MIKRLNNNFTLNGKSGRKYTFEMYVFDDFDDVKDAFIDASAIYIFTRRCQETSDKYAHNLIYCGETGHLNRRFYKHHHESDIKSHHANCLCVMGVSEETREAVEADILENNSFPVNVQHN